MDWDEPVAFEEVCDLVALSRGGAEGEGGRHESTAELPASERVRRLKAALRKRQIDEDLAAGVARAANEALTKVSGEARPALTRGNFVGLEAVVIADGTRPSLRIRNGFVNVRAPEAEPWKVDLMTFADPIAGVISATGRICAPVKGGFAGTALVVSDDLVLTNRHVAELIAHESEEGWRLKWPGETGIDFIAEDLDQIRPSWEVVEVVGVGPERIGTTPTLAKLDFALLRVRRMAPGKLPDPIQRDDGRLIDNKPILTRNRILYAVGVPGRPEPWDGEGRPPIYHETRDVMAKLFGDLFGVKRLAPGRITHMPEDLAAGHGRVFAHDCSTLAGSSGSVLADLAVDASVAAGLHFGGVSRSANYAHGFAAIADPLKAAGLP